MFVVFIVVVITLFYIVKTFPSNADSVAIINGKLISNAELDFWYKLSILPEYRDRMSKQDFLTLSLIPQEVLLQKAEEEKIKVTDDDVEKLIGISIIEGGLTFEEFDEQLNAKGVSKDDIKESFRVRGMILKLLEKENIGSGEEDSFSEEYDAAFQEYIDGLVANADIEIFSDNFGDLELKSFEETDDELCNDGKPVMRLYTSSKCEICQAAGTVFESSVKEFGDKIDAFHWVLDTGDNLLTDELERGVPKAEVSIFKKYSPDSKVPLTVLGCRYKRVGALGSEEAYEFQTITGALVG